MPIKEYEFLFLGGINNTYAFVTDQQIVYELKFKPSSYIFGSQPPFTEFAYEFVIEVAENPSSKLPSSDAAIPHTIATIFNHFFSLKETVVVYICENADGRAHVRNRKFNQWFSQVGKVNLNFVKFDYQFGTKAEYFYTSLIMRIDNPNIDEIIVSFQNLSVDYNDPTK